MVARLKRTTFCSVISEGLLYMMQRYVFMKKVLGMLLKFKNYMYMYLSKVTKITFFFLHHLHIKQFSKRKPQMVLCRLITLYAVKESSIFRRKVCILYPRIFWDFLNFLIKINEHF